MGPLYGDADWIRCEDMAVLMRKSASTVKRAHEQHGLETRLDDAGRVLVNVGDFLRLGKIRPEEAGRSKAAREVDG